MSDYYNYGNKPLTGKPCDKCIHYNGYILVCSKCFNKSEFKRPEEENKNSSPEGQNGVGDQ